jgi:PAS domain S-box-containing protein
METSDRFSASQSEEGRYRLLVEAVTDYAIYMLDADGIVTSWNPGARRFKGYEAREIIGQHFSRFYDDADRALGLPARNLRIATDTGKFEGEGWRIRKDGTRFWAHIIIDPIRSTSGQIVGYAKITRDLTERKQNEEALRQSEQQFRLLVEGVTDYAIYMLSPEGTVASWNAGAQRIKGYAPSEIIGEHFSRFYTEQDRQTGEPMKALAAADLHGRFEKESVRVRKDGTPFIAHVIIDAIRSNEGALVGFAKITRDVTEKKKAERSLETAREALFQSQKMDAIGQLTGGVAHDFNNLLAAILGSLELARRRVPDDEKLVRYLDNAIQGARRGAVLTQRMLAFARRQELKPLAVDLKELVESMSGLLKSSLGPGILFQQSFPEKLRRVSADPNQLELAILNLAVNARDAMAKGGLLRLEGRQEDEHVRLLLIDDGEGMDDETLRRALEPFFTTKGVGKGTGLGLSMVHGMMEQLGGKLTISSDKGKGTTVELWLRNADGAERDDAVASAANNGGAARKRSRLSILVVDDDSLVLANTRDMLDDLGHHVIEAASGSEAVRVLSQAANLDLVITDYAMPTMTGVQLAEEVRRLQPGLPVILATGYAEIPSGSVDLPRLSKPFCQQDLINAIDALEM